MVIYTVKPLRRGHFGTVAFVLCSEAVLFSDVALYNPLNYWRGVGVNRGARYGLEIPCAYQFLDQNHTLTNYLSG